MITTTTKLCLRYILVYRSLGSNVSLQQYVIVYGSRQCYAGTMTFDSLSQPRFIPRFWEWCHGYSYLLLFCYIKIRCLFAAKKVQGDHMYTVYLYYQSDIQGLCYHSQIRYINDRLNYTAVWYECYSSHGLDNANSFIQVNMTVNSNINTSQDLPGYNLLPVSLTLRIPNAKLQCARFQNEEGYYSLDVS